MADIKRQLAGKRSKAAGKSFENELDKACEYYWASGKAHIEKTPEPFRVVRSVGAGKFEGYFEHIAQPDYKGVLKGGQCVCFEAKHTDSAQIKQDAVLLHQTESLNSYAEMGAYCFVMVSIAWEGVYRVPWETWTHMKELFGHKYATAKDLEKFKVPFKNGVFLFLD